MRIKHEKAPKNWDESPKGCWAANPLSRQVCQLKPDGHILHKCKPLTGLELDCWEDVPKNVPLEDVDFRNMDPIEMIRELKARKKPNLQPLIRLLARGHAYDKSNNAARIAIADGEREAESLIGKES